MSSKTVWNPYHAAVRYRWLLRDGTVLGSPPLEITGGGRRVRSEQFPHLSKERADWQSLLYDVVWEIAERRNTSVWAALDAEPGPPDPARLHLLEPDRTGRTTTAEWRFTHPRLPITARLLLTLSKDYSDYYVVHLRMLFPDLRHRVVPEHLEHGHLRDNLGVTPGGWSDALPWETRKCTTPRAAVRAFAEAIAKVDGLASVTIPDSEGEPVLLEFAGSNLGGEFRAALAEYLDGTTLLERAADAYRELQAALAAMGVVLGAGTPDFAAALGTEPGKALTVRVNPVMYDAEAEDAHHVLHVHLPSGTFLVSCDRDRHAEHEERSQETAEAWELARFRAELSGELESFLNYTRTRKNERRQERAAFTIDKRS
jgi:hypothetical protein